MDRRDRYLDAALTLFAAHGFVGTTMDMVVEGVGGSKATLYKNFPSKDALVAGLIDRVSAGVAVANPALRDDVPLESALEQYGQSVLRGVVSDRAVALLRLCLGEYGRFPELSRVVWEHGPAVTYARFRAFLDARVRAHELVVPDTQLAAEQFLAGIVGHLQPKFAMGQARPLTDAEITRRVASATETFLARYRAPTAAPRAARRSARSRRTP
jgi:TetR/AcrR family transcriptional repressor of mexJK operon